MSDSIAHEENFARQRYFRDMIRDYSGIQQKPSYVDVIQRMAMAHSILDPKGASSSSPLSYKPLLSNGKDVTSSLYNKTGISSYQHPGILNPLVLDYIMQYKQ